jgi:hypothetical protein
MLHIVKNVKITVVYLLHMHSVLQIPLQTSIRYYLQMKRYLFSHCQEHFVENQLLGQAAFQPFFWPGS